MAWRLNLASAVCDAAAAGILCFAVSRRTRCWAAGLSAATLFAFAPGVWHYATCAEVFALNNLCVALLLLFAVLYDEHRKRRHALCGALVLGLGLSNHHTVLFTGVPLAMWMLWTGRADFLRPRALAQLAGCLALGLTPYTLLPFERAHSQVAWGTIDSWTGFWRHVLRRDYGTFRLAAPGIGRGASVGRTLAAWCVDLVTQLGWGGVPLAVLCFAANIRRVFSNRGLGLVLCAPPLVGVGVIAALGNIAATTPIYRSILARFWQQPDIFVFVSCGYGLAGLKRILAERVNGKIVGRAVASGAVGASVLAVAPRVPGMDHHKSTAVRDYGAEILRIAPPGALLLTRGDMLTNVVRYLQVVDRERLDVRIVDLELLGFAWSRKQILSLQPEILLPDGRYMPGAADGFTIRQLLDLNIERTPICVCGGFKKGDSSANGRYSRRPFGVCEMVLLKQGPSSQDPEMIEDWLRESAATLPRIEFSGESHAPGSWENVVYNGSLEARRERAMYLLSMAGREDSKRWLVSRAAEILQAIVDEHADAPPHMYKDLAIATARLGPETPEQRTRVVALLRTFLDKEPARTGERRAVEQEINRLEDVVHQ